MRRGEWSVIDLATQPLPVLEVALLDPAAKLSIQSLDVLMQSRPDWIVFRLLRERRINSVFPLRSGCTSSFDMLERALQHGANSSEHCKWAIFGMLSQFILRLLQSKQALHYIRSPKGLPPEEIPAVDIIRSTELDRLIDWLKVRIRKFSKRNAQTGFLTLRENFDRSGLSYDLVQAEQFLLLSLGEILVWLHENEREETATATPIALDRAIFWMHMAHGGWKPGDAVLTGNLRHHRSGFEDYSFFSALLPCRHDEYADWIATSLDRVVQCSAHALPVNTRLLLEISAARLREWQFFVGKTSSSSHRVAIALLTALDRAEVLASESGHVALSGGLAARFLAIGNLVGWEGARHRRLDSAREKKAAAKLGGYLVSGDAAELDLSQEALNSQINYSRSKSSDGPRQEPSNRIYKRRATAPLPSAELLPTLRVEIRNLLKVATAIGWRVRHDDGLRLQIRVLRAATVCLKRPDTRPSNVLALLELADAAFSEFARFKLVAGIAYLHRELAKRNLSRGTIFDSETGLSTFADLLLYWLERPYMADMVERAVWQSELWNAYTNFTLDRSKAITVDCRLAVYSAVSHITAAAMRGLSNLHADQLEATIYAEVNEQQLLIGTSRARTSLSVDTDMLLALFSSFDSLVPGNNVAIVQAVCSRESNVLRVLIIHRLSGRVDVREAEVEFNPIDHYGIEYRNWLDVATASAKHDFFNDYGELLPFASSPLGQQNIFALWGCIERLTCECGYDYGLDLLWFIPDPSIAALPWQLIANSASTFPRKPIIALAHGLRWISLTAHREPIATSGTTYQERQRARGIRAWLAPVASPSEIVDLRPEVSRLFQGVSNEKAVLRDFKGLSLSIVFGHGAIIPGETLPSSQAIDYEDDWDDVRTSRICLVLSCYNGSGHGGALGDFVSITHKLSRKAKSIIVPPVEVPHTAVMAVCDTFAFAVSEAADLSQNQCSLTVQELYRAALEKSPAVALFSLWGVPHEPLIWRKGTQELPIPPAELG